MEEKILIGFLIKQIHIAFETRCHKNLQRYNLTPSQMDVLLYLKDMRKINLLKGI